MADASGHVKLGIYTYVLTDEYDPPVKSKQGPAWSAPPGRW